MVLCIWVLSLSRMILRFIRVLPVSAAYFCFLRLPSRFPLSLCFCSTLTVVCLDVFFFVFNLLSVAEFLGSVVCCFSLMLENLGPLFLQIFLMPLSLSISSFWESYDVYVGMLDGISQILQALFIFLCCFFSAPQTE